MLLSESVVLLYVAGLLRWVHTCNATAYRNAVTLQETDTIRSYELNFHPVLYGVRVSCDRYGVPCLLREQRAVVTCHAARPHLIRP